MKQFRVRFNKGKQSVMFHIGEPLKAFREKHQCHAWYSNAVQRKTRSGLFGHIHLPSPRGMKRIEFDELAVHEIYHLIDDWWRCRKGNVMSDNNEEDRATLAGELYRKFLQKLERNRV